MSTLPIIVNPYNTLALASDENFEVYINSTIDGSIDVEHNDTVVKTVSFTAGQSIVSIGTPNDFILTSDSGTEVRLRIKDVNGNEIMIVLLRVYFIDGTNGTIEFHDEDDAQLVGNIALVYINEDAAYIRQYRGYVISIPASSSLPYNKMFVEYLSYKDGKKYYFVKRIDKFTLGTVNIVKLTPQNTYDVHVILEIDTTRLPRFMDWMASGFGWLIQVSSSITVATLIANYYDPIVRAIFNYLGIHIPIIKTEYLGNNRVKVVFRVDPVDKLVIVAIIIASIISGIIAFKILDVYAEQLATVSIIETSKIIQQYNDLRAQMISKCGELASTPQEYIQCVRDVDRFMKNATSHDRQLLKETKDDRDRKASELEDLKKIIITFGIVAGGLLLLKTGVT